MARDLLLPVEVVGCPPCVSRGLALSSRNAYLSAAERERALTIPRALAAQPLPSRPASAAPVADRDRATSCMTEV